jgi:hypothetical protein
MLQSKILFETYENIAFQQHGSLLWPLMKGILGIKTVSGMAAERLVSGKA